MLPSIQQQDEGYIGSSHPCLEVSTVDINTLPVVSVDRMKRKRTCSSSSSDSSFMVPRFSVPSENSNIQTEPQTGEKDTLQSSTVRFCISIDSHRRLF